MRKRLDPKKRLFSVIGSAVLTALLLGLIASDWAKVPVLNSTVTESDVGSEPQSENEWFRVLAFGVDRTSGLSDVILLASLNRTTGKIGILQIPRDTYAAYTDRSYCKLNGAPTALGLSQAKDFLSEALGLSIDRYVRLSLDTVTRAVDAVGGVEITLTETMDYDDPSQGLSIHLPVGTQTLNGKTAEQFLRFRSGYLRGDLDRMDAQKVFLLACFRKLKTSFTPQTAMKLASVLTEDTQTDLTASDLLWLIPSLYRAQSAQMVLATAPGEAATAEQSGASYYVLSRSATERLLTEHFGAEQGSFDVNRVFLNPKYQTFQTVYEKDVPFRVFGATSDALASE